MPSAPLADGGESYRGGEGVLGVKRHNSGDIQHSCMFPRVVAPYVRPSRRRMPRCAACRPSGFRRLLPRRWLGHKCSSIKLNSTLHAVTSATLGRSAVGQPSACCCRKRPSGSPPAPRFVIGRPFGLCCRKWPPVPPLPSRLLCCRQSCFPRPCLGLSRCHARRNRVFQLFGRPCLSITAGLPASCSHCCRHQLGRNLFLAKRTIHRARFVEA